MIYRGGSHIPNTKNSPVRRLSEVIDAGNTSCDNYRVSKITKFANMICLYLRSLPSRGAWIEIYSITELVSAGAGRSPRGERGLKLGDTDTATEASQSLPSRGAWIEIKPAKHAKFCGYRRSPRGERGLKSMDTGSLSQTVNSRSPRGERGLKSVPLHILQGTVRRSPRGERGLKSFLRPAWVFPSRVAPLAGSVD